MTQPLETSVKVSERKEVPPTYYDSFFSTNNNAKALAYAFDIKDSQNRSIFISNPEGPIHQDRDEKLIDISMNGKLETPALSLGKHAGAILSTAVLVGEQMLIEQLLRESFNKDKIEELLEQIMGESPDIPQMAQELKEMIASFKRNDQGPIMGLQYAECEPVIHLLRNKLGFDELIKCVKQLEKKGAKTEIVMDAMYYNDSYLLDPFLADPLVKHYEENEVTKSVVRLENALTSLYRLGNVLQSEENTTGLSEGSRGINAGLIPFILKATPKLGKKLDLSLEEGVFSAPSWA